MSMVASKVCLEREALNPATHKLIDLLQTHFESQEPRSLSVPIVIDDHLPHHDLRNDSTTSPPPGLSFDSPVRDLPNDSVSHYLANMTQSHIALSLWQMLLQHEGGKQSQMGCGNPNFLEHAVGKAPVREGPALRALDRQERASQEAGNKGKSRKSRGRTMMICNIPCRIGEQDVITAMESRGFGNAYEFVHIPSRPSQPASNLGYCFVHFFRVADAERFALSFEGYSFTSKGSTKACTVKVADIQGRHRRMARNFQLGQQETECKSES
mmetsp:Transcript_123970/g.193509  ORF Transcript_123970/g.193509 Transcript_123970/m.193509 type:complete len:269 (+) Transcript_123970:70-876(+)